MQVQILSVEIFAVEVSKIFLILAIVYSRIRRKTECDLDLDHSGSQAQNNTTASTASAASEFIIYFHLSER